LNSNPINVALELHPSLTNTTHPFPSPIVPGNLAGDPTAVDARYLAVDRPPRASTGQIGPTSVIPYARLCLATTPSTQNWATGEEPPLAVGSHRCEPPFSPPRRCYPTPPPDAWTRAHGVRPRRSSLPWAGWAACLRARVPALGWAEIPPGPVSRENPFLFPFSLLFPIFLILMHILILYAPKIV
jgi:hypothetical protein